MSVHWPSIFKKVGAFIGILGGLFGLVTFFFNTFVSKEVYDTEIGSMKENMAEKEELTAGLFREIIDGQTQIKLDIQNLKIEALIESLKVRRDFLRSRDELTRSEKKELELLDQKIEENLAILN